MYNQSHSSSHATADELTDFEVQAISSNISSVDKTPEHNSGSVKCPKISSPDSRATMLMHNGVPMLNSLPSSWSPDKTETPQKDESSNNLEDNARASGATPANDSRLEIKRNQEKPQSHGRNVPKLHLSRQEDIARRVHGGHAQTISQGMSYLESSMEEPSLGHPNLSSIEVQPSLHWHGFTPPFYEAAAAYQASGNTPFYPDLQPSSLHAPQYCLPGYVLSCTLLPHFMAGYPSHSVLPPPFSVTSSPVYTDRTARISMGEGNLRGRDVLHQRKFYGRPEPIPQPSFVNPLHMHYYLNPSHEIYGSSVQRGQFASRGIIGSQFTQLTSPFSAYVGDHQFQSVTNESLGISAPRNMGISGYGNSPFMSGMTQFPASPLATPLIPSSSIGGANQSHRQTEMRFPQAVIREPGMYSGSQGKRGSNDMDDLNKHSFLEELRSSNSERLKLSDIEGRVVEFRHCSAPCLFVSKKIVVA